MTIIILTYILKGDITIIGHSLAIEAAFKNWVPFIKLSQKLCGTRIVDAEDLDLVIPVNNCYNAARIV